MIEKLMDPQTSTVLIVVLIVAIIGAKAVNAWLRRRIARAEAVAKPQALFEGSTADDKARVKAVLPEKGSEDVSHLLEVPGPEETRRVVDGIYEVKDNEQLDWIIDIEMKSPTSVPETKVLDTFPNMIVHGSEEKTGLWTSCGRHSNGRVLNMTRLGVETVMFMPLNDFKIPTTAQLDELLKKVETSARALGEVEIRPRFSAEEAVSRAEGFKKIWENEDEEDNAVNVVLMAPAGGFSGKDVWDVMLCLGIEWGDMDIFHRLNTSDAGDQDLFSVWTNTGCGYFFPETIADETYADLVFGMDIARSYKPVAVFDAMMRGVHYAQNRLRGEICDEEGEPLDEAAMRARIDKRARHLTKIGITPGSHNALRIF